MSLATRLDALVTSIGGHLKALYARAVPAGGSTGQVLVKASGLNYDTVWSTLSGGGGAVQVFVQDTQPADTGQPYIWVQTGLPGGGHTVWFNPTGTA